MFRFVTTLLAVGLMVTLTDVTASAAPHHRLVGTNTGKVQTAHARGKGVLHIHVRGAGGHAAGHALVTLTARHWRMVRRADRAGYLTVSIEPHAGLMVHARGQHGATGSAGASVVRGSHSAVMIQLRGGRGGLSTAFHFHHRHQALGLGLHHHILGGHSTTSDQPKKQGKPEPKLGLH